MKTLNLVQGSPEWAAHRATCWNASELPSVMNADGAYASRTELLRRKATGIEPEISPQQQARFDAGHAAEAAARLLLEEELGIEFYPVTGVSENEPRLSASFDGLDMLEGVGFEHKLWNQSLAVALNSGTIPSKYLHQLHQQFAVCETLGAIYFVCSDGTRNNWAQVIVRRPDVEALAYIIPAWTQFGIDVASYQPGPVAAELVGKSMTDLPALFVEVEGRVTRSNLGAFKSAALEIIGAINTDLQSDQDFADAEKAIKWCEGVETKLDAQKSAILAQTATIDEAIRTLADVQAATRDQRLLLNKLVKSQKEARKTEIMQAAQQAFREHVAAIESTLPVRLNPAAPDLVGAAKNKRTLQSLKDAVDGELANSKLAASMRADVIRQNCAAVPDSHRFLFNDLQAIADKEPEHFELLVESRVTEHKREEAERLQQERASIEAEAKAKAEAEARAALEEERDALRLTDEDAIDAAIAAGKDQAPTAKVSPLPVTEKQRVSGWDMIQVLALHYRQHESVIVQRLQDDMPEINRMLKEAI